MIHSKKCTKSLLFIFTILLLGCLINNEGYAQSKYRFKIIFKDGHADTIKSKIYYDELKKKNYVMDKTMKIYPSITDSMLVLNNKSPIIGYSFDNTWLFKVIGGDINCLSYFPETGNMTIENNFSKNFFYKKGDTTLTPFSKIKFEEMLQDKPAAFSYYKKRRKIFKSTAIGGIIGFAGGIGFVLAVPDEGIAAIGGAVALCSIPALVVAYSFRNYHVKALKRYNSIRR